MLEHIEHDHVNFRIRHTNRMLPYILCEPYKEELKENNKESKVSEYPEQNKDLLNTMVDIRFRNMYINDKHPEDIEDKPEEFDPHDIYTSSCVVVRCDAVEPYIMICISNTYEFVFVLDSRHYNEIVTQYPIQFSSIIGLEVEHDYLGNHDIDPINGVIIRCDNGEPCKMVIMDFLDDDTVRFMTGDELLYKFIVNHMSELEMIEKSNETITEFRKNLMEGVKIYEGN